MRYETKSLCEMSVMKHSSRLCGQKTCNHRIHVGARNQLLRSSVANRKLTQICLMCIDTGISGSIDRLITARGATFRLEERIAVCRVAIISREIW